MNQWLSKLRKLPGKMNLRREGLVALCVLFVGIGMGVVCKVTDSASGIGGIAQDLSIWVLFCALIAAYSRHPAGAAVNDMVFFLGVTAGYYLYNRIFLGAYSSTYLIGWLIIALISFPCGFLLWFSRSEGWPGAVLAALPAGLIFACSLPALYTGNIVLLLGFAFGVLLCALLPGGVKMKLASLGFSAAVAVIIRALAF
jgi:hypothetical protein